MSNAADNNNETSNKDPSLSYRYWVGARGDGTEQAAPPPQPRKLTPEEAASLHRVGSQGSAWNQGGTWEERTLNDWAKSTLRELLRFSAGVSLRGEAYSVATELSDISGDTTLVVVRNKKKPGYMLDISIKFKARCEADAEKLVEGTMHIPEATFGDVDSTHLEVKIDKTGPFESFKPEVESSLRTGLLPLFQEKLVVFEGELSKR